MLTKYYLPYKKCMLNIVLNQNKNQNTWKEKNSYCLVCEEKIDNENIKGVPLENKIVQQGSGK